MHALVMRSLYSLGLATVASLCCLVPIVDARLYESLQEFATANANNGPGLSKFDFIIIGGGTAGSVLANRLSENPSYQVVLLEAGPNNLPSPLPLVVPGLNEQIGAGYQWNYTTVPQAGAGDRVIPAPRGYVLGGSSSINGMVYTLGSKDDYNLWGKVTKDSRWSWSALEPWLRKHEKWTPPVGGRSAAGQYNPSLHATSGPIRTTLTWSAPNSYNDRNTQNVLLRPGEFRSKLDSNDGEPIGLSWTQFTFGGGERSSAATGYLSATIRQRENLHIVVNARAKRVVSTSSTPRGRNPDVRTVEIISSNSNTALTLTARKEVILSGGAYGTPKILMHSGIGEKAHLTSVGVPTLVDLPDVGKGLTDHVGSFVVWGTTNTPTPVDNAAALAQWQLDRTGPLSEYGIIGRQILWSRIAANNSIFSQYPDPSSGLTSPHIEITLGLSSATLVALVVLVTPHSRGTVRLSSSNPLDAPIIDPAYLSHPFDIKALTEGIRIAKNWYSGPAWDGLITNFIGPDPDVMPQAAFEAALRNGMKTTYHPVGTAAMSAKGATTGVLDPDLKVKGVNGLRVVDASAIPYVPTGHMQAPVYVLAERAADIIRNAW